MKKILLAFVAILATAQLHASLDGFFQLAVFSPGELPGPSYTIKGCRLSLIYGECHEFYGIDIGLADTVRERMYGLQTGAFWNDVGTDAFGIQIGCANNVDGDFSGIQIGLFDAAGNVYGTQIGLVNCAWDSACGLQLGLVNWSENLYGCQIGLVNCVTGRSWSVWPIVNIGW